MKTIMKKSKTIQIITGILTAVAVWCAAPFFAGVFVFGDVLDFARTGLLPFVYPLLFCAALIVIGILAGKNNKPFYFEAALITFASPAAFGLIFWIINLIATRISGSFASPLVFLGLPLSLPMSVVEGMARGLERFGWKSYDTKTLIVVAAAMVIPAAAGFIGAIAAYKKEKLKRRIKNTVWNP